jgi:hypothetical protein
MSKEEHCAFCWLSVVNFFKSDVTVECKVTKWRSCRNLVIFWIGGVKYRIVCGTTDRHWPMPNDS